VKREERKGKRKEKRRKGKYRVFDSHILSLSCKVRGSDGMCGRSRRREDVAIEGLVVDYMVVLMKGMRIERKEKETYSMSCKVE
jgi:hypothetical protein